MTFVFENEMNDIMLEMPDDMQDLVAIGVCNRGEMCLRYKKFIEDDLNPCLCGNKPNCFKSKNGWDVQCMHCGMNTSI